ncbi:hypothetical protein GCK72_020661 [Caenorhabditis remanei]|uniref:Receptor L-domain domain-containing protein n=1 Tax=Caenorhabditis remanei TaxID=31234 RepID=A0A6A5GHE0_CAERE|nr:hypothetical protein GCK72_020655 [Caenorhabditis remanei]XP_053582637.1 hypothetical protein GCK72_020661 [Caenorhabditis remanei]KAF1754097.1 hypothetical protein GCK72_020655 [Caenorhabditis remanei]KAF1754103.1 hypothetical protein GCK72_020661 [Caenorhabditis remanei]
MAIFFCLIAYIFLIQFSLGNYDKDLKHVLDAYKENPDCVFNYTQVNSTTIKFFPQCEMVYAIIVINSDTDLSGDQIKTAFKNMSTLVGGIRVENSDLTNFSFVTPHKTRGYVGFYCETYGLFIKNNSYLTNVSMLSNIRLYPGNSPGDCVIQVKDNKLLDMEKLCDNGWLAESTDLTTTGNLKNCGCQISEISSSAQNCSATYNGIQLLNVSVNTSHFSNIKLVKGIINIQDTNLQNLSFLKSFQYWTNIENNAPDGITLANFENLHPDFCLSLSEMMILLELNLPFVNLQAKFCEDPGDIGELILCRFTSMYDLPNNCDIVLGDLKIEKGDEDDCTKLNNMKYLFGALIVQNTELTDLDNLAACKHIVSLNDSYPVIQFISNKKLKNLELRYIYSITTRGKREAIIQDNDLFKAELGNQSCQLFQSYTEYSEYVTRLVYIGGDCGKYTL